MRGAGFLCRKYREASTDTKDSTPNNRKPVFGDKDLHKLAQFVNSLRLLCELFQVLLESIKHPEGFMMTIGVTLVPDGAVVSAKVRRLAVEIKRFFRFFIPFAGGRRATLGDIGFHHGDQGMRRLLRCTVEKLREDFCQPVQCHLVVLSAIGTQGQNAAMSEVRWFFGQFLVIKSNLVDLLDQAWIKEDQPFDLPGQPRHLLESKLR